MNEKLLQSSGIKWSDYSWRTNFNMVIIGLWRGKIACLKHCLDICSFNPMQNFTFLFCWFIMCIIVCNMNTSYSCIFSIWISKSDAIFVPYSNCGKVIIFPSFMYIFRHLGWIKNSETGSLSLSYLQSLVTKFIKNIKSK
jgi:hypothetical protein